MAEIREVIYQHSQGMSQRKIAESLGMSRLTIRKYIKIAEEFNYKAGVVETLKICEIFYRISIDSDMLSDTF